MRFLALVLGLLAAGSATATDAVDFTLPDLQGKQHSLSDYRGKWVVVNYWATWCPPCLDEIPDLIDFHEAHKDKDAVVIGVNYEEVDAEYLKEFVEGLFINYPVLRSEPLPVSPLGPVLGLPTTYIISPRGERVARQEGPVTGKALEAFLERKKQELSSRLLPVSVADSKPAASR